MHRHLVGWCVLACLLSACTPSLVPVNVTPPTNIAAAALRLKRVTLHADAAQLTRGATAEGALGTKWMIDARPAFMAATRAAFPEGSQGQDGGVLLLTLRDFDVDWTVRTAGGVSEVTFRALAQIEYDYTAETGVRKSGSVVGRGRQVETGWGPKIDQRLGRSIDRVASEAIGAAFADIVRDLARD